MGYSKEIYQRAYEKLDQRRKAAQDEALARRQEIHRRIPEVDVLERKMAATAAAVTKTVLTSPGNAGDLVNRLGEENQQLQSRRAQLLQAAGLPADYLKERHHCATCRDTGYTGTVMCACLRELLRQEAFAHLSQTAPAVDCTFDSFRLDVYPLQPDRAGVVPRRQMEDVRSACMNYAREFQPRGDSLLMLGQTGLGKTHLSLAIAREVTEQGHGVVYTPVQRLMDRLEADKFSRGQESREQYLDNMSHILECDLLVLDDLGTEFTTSFTNSVLYNIVNSRLVERRPTVISTNLDLSAIEDRYSQRMVSRLVCGCKVLKFCGEDVRYIKKMQSMQ